MTGNRDRTKVNVVYGTCAFEGCGRRFRQHGGAGRPRAYCQAACRRRAQRVRDRARKGERLVRGRALDRATDPLRRSGRPGAAAPARSSPDGLVASDLVLAAVYVQVGAHHVAAVRGGEEGDRGSDFLRASDPADGDL